MIGQLQTRSKTPRVQLSEVSRKQKQQKKTVLDLSDLPTRHIEYDNGRLYELQIKTTIRNEAGFLDFTGDIPCYLHSADIAQLIETDQTKNKWLLPQLVDTLEENWQWVPIEDTDMSQAEVTLLKAFISTLKPEQSCMFNFSMAIYETLSTAQAVVVDFVQTKPETTGIKENLIKTTGTELKAAVFKPFLSFCIQEQGLGMDIDRIVQAKKDDTIDKDRQRINDAEAHINSGQYQDAVTLAYQIIKSDNELAANAYHLLAKVYLKQGYLDNAQTQLDAARELAPHNTLLYLDYINLFAQLDDNKGLINAIKNYLKHTNTLAPILWDHVITLVLMLIKTQDIESAKQWHATLLTLKTRHPNLIPNFVKEKLTLVSPLLDKTATA